MRTIQLYRDGTPVAHVLVSDVDHPHLSTYSWHTECGRVVKKEPYGHGEKIIHMLDVIAASIGVTNPKLRIPDPWDLRRTNIQGYNPHHTPGIKWSTNRQAWVVKMQLDGRPTLLGWTPDLTKAENMLREADAKRAEPQLMAVKWNEDTKRWTSRVRIDGKPYTVGHYIELAAASRATSQYLAHYKANQ